MPHPDPDDLALIAIGERPDSSIDSHIATCELCQADLTSLREAAELAPLSNYGEDAQPANEYVWDAIAAELGFAEERRATATLDGPAGPPHDPLPHLDEHRPSTPPTPRTAPDDVESDARPRLSAVPSAEGAGAEPPSSTPAPGAGGTGGPASSRRSRWIAVLAAAVIGIALGAGGYALFASRTSTPQVEATATLTPVPDGPLASDGTLGTADLLAATNGEQVRVTAPALPAIPGAYEVWLFGNDGRMISLGSLNQGEGTFTVPQGIDTQEYRTIDISDEPPDGVPTHSGISVVRGEFS